MRLVLHPGFAWRRWRSLGGRVISPTFDSPQQAGEWRGVHGPERHATLIYLDGEGREHAADLEVVCQAVIAWVSVRRERRTGSTEEVHRTVGG